MKINYAPNLRQNWHRWFAWKPTYVATDDCRWLEYIERRCDQWDDWGHSGTNWQYRALIVTSNS